MEANFVEAMKSIIIPSYDTCLDFFSLSETTYSYIVNGYVSIIKLKNNKQEPSTSPVSRYLFSYLLNTSL